MAEAARQLSQPVAINPPLTVVKVNVEATQPDELTIAFTIIRGAATLAAVILRKRCANWWRRHVLQSLYFWKASAGAGWGLALGSIAFVFLMR